MNDPFDPHLLDWSRHRSGPARAESGPGVFLADAAAMIGEALLEGWHGGETSAIASEAPPRPIPLAAEAFDEAGRPVPGVHQAFGRQVVDRIGHGEWASLEPQRSDRIAWLASHVPDPAGGPPIPASELLVDQETGDDRMISAEHWNWAHADIEILIGTREWALTALTAVADAIVDLTATAESAVKTFARPLEGGPSVLLPRETWHVGHETRMRRLASCGLNLGAPFDPTAPVDSLLFLADEGLGDTIARYCATRRVPILPEDHAWWDEGVRQRIPRYGSMEARVRAELETVLLLPENRFWRSRQACDHIANHPAFGGNLDGLVKRVCADLQKEGTQYASLGRSGRPRKGLELRPKRKR